MQTDAAAEDDDDLLANRLDFRQAVRREENGPISPQLADDPAMLPACARAVLAGGERTTEYWQWLIERWDAVQESEVAS